MKTELKTPQWVDSILARLAPDNLAEEIRGDLYELFLKDIEERNLRTARRKYVVNALGFLVKRFFWKRSTYSTSNLFAMLGSYFKMAQRSLRAHKGTSIINITGLVIGIASALVILTVIKYELGFNLFHSDADRIYRMVRVSGEDMSEFRTGVSYPVPAAMKEEITSLENTTSMEYFGGGYVDVMDPAGKSIAMFREDRGCVMVEPSFFQVFDFRDTDFKWIEGNPEKALVEPFSVVLTESMAKKYFPGGNPVGKSLRFEKFFDSKVTGVISDFPPNCDFPFTILISYSSIFKMRSAGQMENWFGVNDTHHVYIKLAPGTTEAEMEGQIASVHAAHTPKDLHESRHYLLQKLSDIHFDARFGTYSGRTISKETILALGLVALFLLLTASINYINLATAQSTVRSKEIGLRKVMGSYRNNLVAQFMTETFVIVLIAGLLALVISEVLLINLRTLLNLDLTRFNFTDPFILLSLLSIIILVTVFAGFYPSMVISRFNPVQAMKNSLATETIGSISLRKVLVVAQFTITQVLVVGTFIVVSQMKYFQNVNMGFNREAVITLNLPNISTPRHFNAMDDQLRSQSFVSGMTFSSTLPSGLNRSRSFQGVGRKEASASKDFLVFEYQAIDPDYINLFQIKLLAGRNLTLNDSTGNVLINRTLMKNLQFGNPREAVGAELKMGGGQIVTIAGIVDDVYSNSLKESADNTVMVINFMASDYCSIKLSGTDGGSLKEAIGKIEKVWASVYPEHIFNYQFLDENVKAFYVQEEKSAHLFQLFSLIFLVIGCLGLYGLITFVVNRKSKEVAIRKVLGADIRHILMMFSGEYVRLIIVSFLLAVPIAWFAVDSWLSNFANRIPLQWWLFVLPGIAVLAIALFIVITKSFRTANANPVDKLKYE
jgi:putative ABC transport system permease protein